MKFRTTVLLLIISMINGCSPIPFPKNIYKPSAEGGVLKESMCGYNSGPGVWDELEIKLSSIALIASATIGEKNEIRMFMRIDARTAQDFRFVSRDFIFKYDGSDVVHKADKIQSYKMISGEMESNSFDFDALIKKGEGASFYSNFDIEIPSDKSFVMKVPNITVDGVEYVVPEITFKRDTSWYFLTINC